MLQMVEKLNYRQGSIHDVNQIKELSIVSYSQYSEILTPENWKSLNKFLNDDKALLDLITKAESFLCTDNNIIVGMAYLIPSGNPTDIYQENWCYIRMVGVHPNYTGNGIGRKLTMLCIEKAKEMGEKTIALHTSEFMDAARHIYESIGFKILKEIPRRLGKIYWLYTLDL